MLPPQLQIGCKNTMTHCFNSLMESEHVYWVKMLENLCQLNSKAAGHYQDQIKSPLGILVRGNWAILPMPSRGYSGYPIAPQHAQDLNEVLAARAEIERKERVIMNAINKVFQLAETIQDLRDAFIDEFFEPDPLFKTISRTRPTGFWYQPNTLNARIDTKAQLEIKTVLALRLLR